MQKTSCASLQNRRYAFFRQARSGLGARDSAARGGRRWNFFFIIFLRFSLPCLFRLHAFLVLVRKTRKKKRPFCTDRRNKEQTAVINIRKYKRIFIYHCSLFSCFFFSLDGQTTWVCTMNSQNSSFHLLQVGVNYKTPNYPIWVICSESHFSVLFSIDRNLLDDW